MMKLLGFPAALLPMLFCWAEAQTFTPFEDDELLPGEEAFRFSAIPYDDGSIEARWEIAEDYYMYRDKLKFRVAEEGISVVSADYPPGEAKEDPLFGDVEVYIGRFVTRLAVEGRDGPFTLVAEGQGCNEPVGVCYAPITVETPFVRSADGMVLAAATEGALAGSGADAAGEQPSRDGNAGLPQPGSVADLRALLDESFSQPDFLPVEEAFVLEGLTLGNGSVTGGFRVAQGYYLYRDKLTFELDGQPLSDLSTTPAPVSYEDNYFGKTDIFRDDFRFAVGLPGQMPVLPDATLTVGYQGCADGKICYPPASRSFSLVSLAAAQEPGTPAAAAPDNGRNDGTTTLVVALIGAFAAGLLLTFTPCVLPMIPILSSVIVGQGDALTRSRSFMLSVTYVLGTAVTYALMGALAGATGAQLQAYFQNAWAIGTLSVLFVAMALSMFGLFELQMPSFIQSAIQNKTRRLSDSIPLVFGLGLGSALIIGACVSPILISALSAAVAASDPVLGAQTMFAMALGMGVPLVAIGTGAGYLVPRAGPWMETIKHVFGFMLLAVAIYLLEALPRVPVLLLWGMFLILLSGYIEGDGTARKLAPPWNMLYRNLGRIVLIWGVCAMIGGFMGERNLFRPLPQSLFGAVTGTGYQAEAEHVFTRIRDVGELEAHLAGAGAENRTVLVDYYADWCTDCTKMEESTFKDSDVVALLEKRFVPLQVDVTDPGNDSANALKQRFGIFGPPAIIFLDRAGKAMDPFSFYGYKGPEEFLAHLDSVPEPIPGY